MTHHRDDEGEREPCCRLAAQLLGPVRLRTCDGIPWSREREAAAAAAQARLWTIVGVVARERRRAADRRA
mgnify:FL=1